MISTSPSAKGVVRVELPTSRYAPLLLPALAHVAAVTKPNAMQAAVRLPSLTVCSLFFTAQKFG
jgi:hypothetical protein